MQKTTRSAIRLPLVSRSSSSPLPPLSTPRAPLPGATPSAEEEAEAWLRSQDAVAGRLEEELAQAKELVAVAQARVRRIEDMLARVRGTVGSLETGSNVTENLISEEIDLESATISEAIWFAVAAHRHGATAAEIQSWVADRGRAITTKYLHTYVHRMLGDKRLRFEGAKGSRKYFLGKPREYSLSNLVMKPEGTL